MISFLSIRFAANRLGLLFLLCLLALPISAQDSQSGVPGNNPTWQPPDIASLPLQWWDDFDATQPDQFQQRMSLFIAALEQKRLGLGGDDLVDAQNLLNGLHEQSELLMLALEGMERKPSEPILTQDVYTLDELLAIRQQWRDIQDQKEIPILRVEELKSRAALQQNRQDDLLRQYDAADDHSPERILLGLQRISSRLDHELSIQGLAYHEAHLADLSDQEELLADRQEFAQARLEGGETDWHAIEDELAAIRINSAAELAKVASLQHQLVEVLSAENPKPSLELLRRQQLTRALAGQSLASVRDSLDTARINWYRFRSGTLDSGFDIGEEITRTNDVLLDATQQIEIWTATSQTTLISRMPDSGLNARKNLDLAHKAAQETLKIINQIQGNSDDLSFVIDILASDMVESESLFKSMETRLSLVSAEVWSGLQSVLDYDLFHIGDKPVTPGRIALMFLIIIFGFLLSWVIRRLLMRLDGLRKFAKSSATYTLGRVFHYVIILVSFLVALSSIGLDFTNFALIAGALSVGIGFGLQGIVNNFLSGLILLFEGSLRVGDYIELDNGLRGTVREINTRAAVINTNDSVDVVVPNSELVSTRLTNWTLREPVARLRFDFGVAYGSAKELVKEAAVEAAAEVEHILHHAPGREPQVWMTGFGESSLDFQLLAWVSRAGVRRPGRTRSQFFWALESKLEERGIEIPFPQRDLHLRNGFDPSDDDEPAPTLPEKI